MIKAMEGGWFFTTANWNEHKDVRGLPVHPDDLNAGLVIPQYELVAVENGYIRPLYDDPTKTGLLFTSGTEPSRKVAGYLIDTPYDEDGVVKKERKLCIIREGRVILPALVFPPENDWMLLRKSEYPFLLGRYPVNNENHVFATLYVGMVSPNEEELYGIRVGVCRDIRIRQYYVGGTYQWMHQAKCCFKPAFILSWGWG
jgi:hypothetical protein